MEGAGRLDEDLWRPTALGCRGPGELAGVAMGRDVLYRPLLAVHLVEPTPDPGDEGTVEVVAGEAVWARLLAEPDVQMSGGRAHALVHLRTDPRAVVVAVRQWPGEGLRAVLAVRVDRLEPRVAELAMAWLPQGTRADIDDHIARGWLALFRAAAHRGVVGLTADVTHTGARKVEALRRHVGFRPVAEVYAEVGLGAVDAHLELDRWTALVAADGTVEVRIALAGDDPASIADLALQMSRLLEGRRPGGDEGTDPVGPGVAMRLTGVVQVDRCAGWSCGPASVPEGLASDDPGDTPDDRRSAEACLARWAHAHRPPSEPGAGAT